MPRDYIAVSTLDFNTTDHDGRHYEAGATLTLDEDVAAPLVKLHILREKTDEDRSAEAVPTAAMAPVEHSHSAEEDHL